MNTYFIQQCYAVAWRSFKKWWIPLCLISTFILVFDVIPRIMIHPEAKAFKQFAIDSVSTILTAVKTGDVETFDVVILDLHEKLVVLMVKMIKIFAVLFPFVALLTMVLLTWANGAVKDRRDQNSMGRMSYIAGVHVLMATLKAVAFLFCILPGVYIYVRLFFVSLIMLENNECRVGEAMRQSWILSRGNFWELLVVIVISAFCQFLAAPTIIGLIPVTGFANTARAAAYQMLKSTRIHEM